LADALVLETSGLYCVGSSPTAPSEV
jgi:hypothetical protein